eukprot:COSAG02_NODE_253_length_26942_cov_80.561152_11_plen_74_part_00
MGGGSRITHSVSRAAPGQKVAGTQGSGTDRDQASCDRNSDRSGAFAGFFVRLWYVLPEANRSLRALFSDYSKH